MWGGRRDLPPHRAGAPAPLRRTAAAWQHRQAATGERRAPPGTRESVRAVPAQPTDEAVHGGEGRPRAGLPGSPVSSMARAVARWHRRLVSGCRITVRAPGWPISEATWVAGAGLGPGRPTPGKRRPPQGKPKSQPRACRQSDRGAPLDRVGAGARSFRWQPDLSTREPDIGRPDRDSRRGRPPGKNRRQSGAVWGLGR